MAFENCVDCLKLVAEYLLVFFSGQFEFVEVKLRVYVGW